MKTKNTEKLEQLIEEAQKTRAMAKVYTDMGRADDAVRLLDMMMQEVLLILSLKEVSA